MTGPVSGIRALWGHGQLSDKIIHMLLSIPRDYRSPRAVFDDPGWIARPRWHALACTWSLSPPWR